VGVSKPLKYMGGKTGLAATISELMLWDRPIYVEPFFGSGGFFFQKPPHKIEVVNDKSSELVRFYRVMREQPKELKELLLATPIAKDEWRACQELHNCSDLEFARRYFVSMNQSRIPGGSKNSWSNPVDIERVVISDQFYSRAVSLPSFSARLQNVVIENRCALKLIEKFNYPNTIIYCDPPYLGCTQYNETFDEEEHWRFLELCNSSSASILISAFRNELYDELLSHWWRIDVPYPNSLGIGNKRVVESFYMNYEVQGRLW